MMQVLTSIFYNKSTLVQGGILSALQKFVVGNFCMFDSKTILRSCFIDFYLLILLTEKYNTWK